MTNWKEYKVEEFAEVIGGGTPSTKNSDYFGGSIPWLTPRDLTNYEKRYITNGERNITNEGLRNSSAKLIPKHSILLTSRAPIGYLAIASNEVTTNQGFKSLVVNPDIANYKFVFYLVKANIERIKSFGTGTTFAEISASVVKNLKFNLPDLPTQTSIAEILSSLDDKIELNNKINQQLENLAQTLFKQWFIDFEFPNENGEPYKSSGGEMIDSELGEIPKGWEVKKLGELVKKSNTGADAIKRAPIVNEDTGIRCVRVGDMTNKRPFDEWGFCKITPQDYKRYKLEINDIVVTRTATLGINTIIRNEIKGVYNNGLIRLKIDENKIIPLLAYCFLQSDAYKIWIERISGDSSTRPNMQINYLLDFPMYQCPMTIQTKFINQASLIFENLENNILENKELIQLRDTLLPKLISGELEVSELLAQNA